jgi:Rod binding domain-containing protein
MIKSLSESSPVSAIIDTTLSRTSFGETAISSNASPKEAAKQFESLLLQQMISSMWESVPKGGLLSGGKEEQFFSDMLHEALAKSIAEGEGIGISEVLEKDIVNTMKKEGRV